MISCKIISYTGHYAAGYGKIEKGKIEANQWILEVLVDDKIEQFVLEKNIYQVTDVTSVLPLEFCSGILGTKYLKIN
jgi:hypothetical protein